VRIAYIAPYIGSTVLKQRPILRNLSNSNQIKIELICRLLHGLSHEIDVISQGEVIEPRFWYYKGFREPNFPHPDVPAFYASALPIPRLNGLWSSFSALRIFKRRHQTAPYDLVILFNMKRPQVAVGNYARQRLKLPVILEYEDDHFVDVTGAQVSGLIASYHRANYQRTLDSVSGCMAVSQHLLSQAPSNIPKFLFRGVIGEDVVEAGKSAPSDKQNWVLFSGTHVPSNGVAQLIDAWALANLPGWELHITGRGELTEQLRKMAKNKRSIVFHGMVERPELVRLISSARIGINPHTVSRTAGNVFAFKIIEYLGAGAHVVTTPMGGIESDLEPGITFMPDNSPATIAKTLTHVISQRSYERTAAPAAIAKYGPKAVQTALNKLLKQVTEACAERNENNPEKFRFQPAA
jgi:glycosyltransferase involved in cell wall biosynthesis